jgi:hypothetical protein
MTPLEQEIVNLSKIWYNFVSLDHHKDRDCHWYIEQYFSYGDAPYYQAHHNGYIGDRFEGTKCTTLEEAQEELRDRLALEIHKAKVWVTRNLEEIKKIEADGSDEMYFGSSEEYERMLHYLNGGEWIEREEVS